jgi:hypothetical protein
VKRGIVLGLALAVVLTVFGRWAWQRWRAYDDVRDMRMRAAWE